MPEAHSDFKSIIAEMNEKQERRSKRYGAIVWFAIGFFMGSVVAAMAVTFFT